MYVAKILYDLTRKKSGQNHLSSSIVELSSADCNAHSEPTAVEPRVPIILYPYHFASLLMLWLYSRAGAGAQYPY